MARIPSARTHQEDLEQELLLQVHRHQDRLGSSYDALPEVLADLLDSRLFKFKRAIFAQKRDPRRTRSLHARVRAADGVVVELGETVDEHAHHRRLNRQALLCQEALELALDVAAVLATLPRELRILAERLMQQSLSEAAVDLGTPRSTLQGGARALRRVFEQAGFEATSLRGRRPARSPIRASGEGQV
jgi:hypothetical protein